MPEAPFSSTPLTGSNPLSVYPRTTVLVVEPEYVADAAVLCSLLGDEWKSRSDRHGGNSNTVRVVTSQPELFESTDACKNGHNQLSFIPTPLAWRCHEKLPQYGNRWATHLGSPDGIYREDELVQALSGTDTLDNGGRADAVLLCGTSRRLLQRVATAVSSMSDSLRGLQNCNMRIGRDSDPRTKQAPLIIGSIAPYRTLEWLARRVFWNGNNFGNCHHCPIVFCAFTSPLWYCRIVRKALVLLVVQSQAKLGHSKLIIRPHGFETHCNNLWKRILDPTQQLNSHPYMAVSPTAVSMYSDALSRGISSSSPWWLLWQGATVLFYQLQDPTIFVNPCLLVAIHEQRSNAQTLRGNIGYHILNMVEEAYQLYYSLSKHLPSEWYAFMVGNDTLLADVIQSNTWVVFTNNTTLEIMDRFEYQQRRRRRRYGGKKLGTIIQHRRWLAPVVSRRANAFWQSATNGIPDELAAEDPDQTKIADIALATRTRLDLDHILQECLSHSLVWILEVGQLLGLDVEQDLPTTLYLTRRLQTMDRTRSTPYVSLHKDLGVLAEGITTTPMSKTSMDIISTKSFGIAKREQLLSFLAMDPTETLLHLPVLQSKL